MDQISEEYFFHLVVSVPEELVQFWGQKSPTSY